MVANLSSHKRGWDARWAEFSDWAEQGQKIKERLVHLIDDDTRAYNRVVVAAGMPRSTAEERAAREAALEAANLGALEVPWQVMNTASQSFDLLYAMAKDGNPASASDAGVGALCARAAIRGAWLNVRTNATSIKNQDSIAAILKEGPGIDREAEKREKAILAIVDQRMSGSPELPAPRDR
jgi:glutamate formiminotransferase/formiminotetrahydrofolate cyclodeaminase